MCTGVDAFSVSWGNKFGLFVPPITLVSRVLTKMQFDKAHCVLVVPLWKSASFWPLIWKGDMFTSNVLDWFDLPAQREYYIPCKNVSGMFGNEDLKLRMLALKFAF